jgi:hypothetical protein
VEKVTEKAVEKQTKTTLGKTILKGIVKIGPKLNIIVDIIQATIGPADMISGAGDMSQYRRLAAEQEKIKSEFADAAKRIETGVSTPEEEQKKNKYLIFRSMQTTNGEWIKSPSIGAGNGRQLGARTPQSVQSADATRDITPVNGMVGPNYSKGGLSTSSSVVEMVQKVISDEYLRKEGAVGMFDKRLLGFLGLDSVADGKIDPKTGKKGGHVTIYPQHDMKIEHYIEALNAIPWVPVFRRSK